MAEGAKKGENHFWDWGLSYEAPFVTIGWKLWEKTSQNPKKALDNYYIDRRGWLSAPKRVKNHFWDWGLSYEAPFVAIGWKLWEKTSQNPKKALDNYYIDLQVTWQAMEYGDPSESMILEKQPTQLTIFRSGNLWHSSCSTSSGSWH